MSLIDPHLVLKLSMQFHIALLPPRHDNSQGATVLSHPELKDGLQGFVPLYYLPAFRWEKRYICFYSMKHGRGEGYLSHDSETLYCKEEGNVQL